MVGILAHVQAPFRGAVHPHEEDKANQQRDAPMHQFSPHCHPKAKEAGLDFFLDTHNVLMFGLSDLILSVIAGPVEPALPLSSAVGAVGGVEFVVGTAAVWTGL